MRRTVGGGLLLAGLVLTGCANGTGADPAGSVPVPPASAAPASQPAGTGTVSPAPDAVLVQFDRQGGLAGLSDALVIRQDGGFILDRTKPAAHRSGQLTPDELAALRRALEQLDFAGLPGTEAASGSDLFTYHVVYGGRQVQAQDTAVATPLRPVIGALTALVDKYSA